MCINRTGVPQLTYLDTPIKHCYSLTERPGYLRLFGNCFDLNSPESPAMLLRKQTSYNESFRAEMIFKPSRAGYESGITVWWSQYSYATIGIAAVREDDGSLAVPTIVTREPTGKVSELKVQRPGASTLVAVANDNRLVTRFFDPRPQHARDWTWITMCSWPSPRSRPNTR